MTLDTVKECKYVKDEITATLLPLKARKDRSGGSRFSRR